MDYNSYNHSTKSQTNPYEKFAFLFGIISILMCSIIYVSFVTGSMAILFAILSKGGNIKFSKKARLGFIFGILGLALTIIFYTIAFKIALEEYGSFEGILREACEMIGYDFESLYSDLNPLSL